MATIVVPNEKKYPVNVCFLGSDTHPTDTDTDGGANLIKKRAAGHLRKTLNLLYIKTV